MLIQKNKMWLCLFFSFFIKASETALFFTKKRIDSFKIGYEYAQQKRKDVNPLKITELGTGKVLSVVTLKTILEAKKQEEQENLKRKEEQENLKRKEEQEKWKCVICWEQIEREQEYGLLACIHFFHAECLRLWAQREMSCPLCRKSFYATLSGTR